MHATAGAWEPIEVGLLPDVPQGRRISMQRPGRRSPLAPVRALGLLGHLCHDAVCVGLSLVNIYMPAASSTCIFLTLTAAWFGTTGAFRRPLTYVYDR